MTDLSDAAPGRVVAARWCTLAEQRLEYLTELFETGRWRRFYNEKQFLENVREAKANVDHWRALSRTSAVQATEEAGTASVEAPIEIPGVISVQPPAAAEPPPVIAPPVEELAAAIAAMPGVAAPRDRYPVLRNEF